MNAGLLFEGIGGFGLACERAGIEPAWHSEVNVSCGREQCDEAAKGGRHASRVLDHHWPGVKNLGDIHGITDAPRVDVLTGGFPCQDYSVAGHRGGLAGDRGALWWQYLRLIAECRPTWVVGENVPGLISSNDGADFETIIGSLTECGYGVAWAVLDAQYFGVAQRRRRVFIVGHSGGEPRPEVLALSEGLFGHPEKSRETGEDTAPTLAARTRGGGGLGTDTEVPALTAKLAKGTGGPAGDEHHHLVLEGEANLGVQGGDVDITGVVLDGGIEHPCDELKVGACECVHVPEPTLPAPSVKAFAQNQRDEVRDLGDQAGALSAEPGMKQQTYVAQTFDWQAGASGDTSWRGKARSWIVDEPERTRSLTANRTLALASPSVRRLTPLECERLQGFPDGWTDIPGNSDTQRYRQLGNAVAVPVAEWIMQRIADAS